MKYVSILVAIFFFSCQTTNSTEGTINQQPFFDLPTFFELEQERLKIDVIALNKKIIINEKIEEKRIDSLNLNQELALFIEADINRPAWLDQYSRDSIKNEQNQLISIHYKALKENLKTKVLSIYFKQGVVTHIKIQKVLSNIAITSSQELVYKTGQGYTIKNEQDLVFSDPQHISLEVNYLRKQNVSSQ